MIDHSLCYLSQMCLVPLPTGLVICTGDRSVAVYDIYKHTATVVKCGGMMMLVMVLMMMMMVVVMTMMMMRMMTVGGEDDDVDHDTIIMFINV